MLERKFDKSEKNLIDLFLKDVSNNMLVEGVYARSFVDDSYNESTDISIIINASEEYFNKVGTYGVDIKECSTALLDLVDYYNSYALSNIKFSTTHALSFTKRKVHFAEATDLVSGEILFDRFGRITELKEKYSEVLSPYLNSIKINSKQIK